MFLQTCRLLALATLLSIGAPFCSALEESNYIVHAQRMPAPRKPDQANTPTSIKKQPPHVQPALATPTSVKALQIAREVPSCAPFTGTTVALPVALSTGSGLKTIIDTPDVYLLSGSSSAEVRGQLQTCAPGNDFAGNTSFWLGTRYNYVTSDNDSCRLTDISVTLRIHQVYPQLVGNPATPASLQAEWKQYITALSVHEHGHVAINEAYAQQALSALQSLPPAPCAQIRTTVDRTMGSITARMHYANEAYDARTNHGATQGAIWR